MMKTSLTLTLFAVGSTLPLSQAGNVADTQRFNLTPAPHVATAPQIDGVVDKREWYGASLLPRLINADRGIASEARERVYVCHGDTALYVAFQFDRPENALVPQAEDAFELIVDSAHDHKTAAAFNGNVESRQDGPLNVQWQYKARPTDFGWEGEIAIPFQSLGRVPPADGEVWGFDFINYQTTPVEQLSGYSFTRKKGNPAEFSHIIFLKGTPPLRFEQFGQFWSEAGGGASLEIANASAQPANLTVSLAVLKRQADAKGSYLPAIVRGHTEAEDIVLAAVEELIKEQLAKYDPVPTATTNAAVSLPANRRAAVRVTATDVGEYLLQYRVARGEQVIGAGVLPFVLAPPIQLTLTPYHLSPGIISVKSDFRRAKEWDTGAKAKFAVVKKAGDAPLSEVVREFTGEREFVVALPTAHLDAGGYLVTMEMIGADGKPVGSLSEGFTKLPTPDWFINRAGLTPAVPPPWKPIKAGAKKMSFLMGDYDLSPLTLPAQVNVRSIYEEKRVPLLTAPIALKGRVNGKEIVWARARARARPSSRTSWQSRAGRLSKRSP